MEFTWKLIMMCSSIEFNELLLRQSSHYGTCPSVSCIIAKPCPLAIYFTTSSFRLSSLLPLSLGAAYRWNTKTMQQKRSNIILPEQTYLLKCKEALITSFLPYQLMLYFCHSSTQSLWNKHKIGKGQRTSTDDTTKLLYKS